jgi:ArsR family transcriptional regulator
MLTDTATMPAARAARLFGLLGDETCLRLLLTLAEGDEGVPVGGLAKALGLSHTALNHHVQMLRMAGVVTRRREEQHVFYSFAPRTRPGHPPPARPGIAAAQEKGRPPTRGRPV